MTTTLNIEIKKEDIHNLINKTGAIGAMDTMHSALAHSGEFLISWIVKNRLSGPRPDVLGRVSGRLASSITMFNFLQDRKNQFSIRIGTNVEYAAKHEFGFIGREQVQAHTRKHRERVSFKRFVARPGSLVAEEKRITRMRTSGYSLIRAFTRNINLPARPFLRPAIEDSSNQQKVAELVKEQIEKAIEGA